MRSKSSIRGLVIAALAALFALCATPALAASSITASLGHVSWGNNTTQVDSAPISMTPGTGKFIGVYVVAAQDVYLTTHISDTIGGVASGNTYTLAFKVTSPSTIAHYYFICENATVGANQVFTVFNPLFTTPTAASVDVRGGVASSSSYDSASYVQAFSNSVTSLAVGPTTPTNDGSLLVLLESQGVGFPTTVTGGGFSAMQEDYAGVGGVNYQAGVATQIQGAKTASNPTVSASSPSSNYIDTIMFAIKPASYGPPGGSGAQVIQNVLN